MICPDVGCVDCSADDLPLLEDSAVAGTSTDVGITTVEIVGDSVAAAVAGVFGNSFMESKFNVDNFGYIQ